MRKSLYLALLPMLCDLVVAFSVQPKTAAAGIKPAQISNTRSAILSAVVAVSLFVGQPSGAYVDPNNHITTSSPNSVTMSTHTINAASSSSSLQLSNSLASPMGEFKPEAETGISPAFSTFGQWFFLLYVVVSLLAGAKEMGGRIMNQMNKDDE